MTMKTSKREQILSECMPKRISSYGSHQWAIVHEPTGRLVEGPTETFDFGKELGVRPINGQVYFARKRDAQAALDALKQQAAALASAQEYDMPRESRANCGRCPIEPADEDAETDAYTMMMGPDAY